MYYIMRKSYYVMHKVLRYAKKLLRYAVIITLCGNYYVMWRHNRVKIMQAPAGTTNVLAYDVVSLASQLAYISGSRRGSLDFANYARA